MLSSWAARDFFLSEGSSVLFTATASYPWQILEMSPNVSHILGHSVHDVQAKFWDMVLGDRPSLETLNRELVEGVLTHGKTICRLQTKYSYIIVQIEARISVDKHGNPFIVGFWTDQTEQERLRAILSAIPDSLFEVDGDGRFLFNQSHTQTGEPIDTSGTLFKTIAEVLPENQSKLLMAAVHRALTTRLPQTVKYALEEGPETQRSYYEAAVGASSTFDTVVVITRNITTEVNREQDLSQQKRRLEEANKSMSQFAYAASHDLREPLVGVSGFATLLRRRYADKLDYTAMEFVNAIVAGTKSMEDKIDDLLTLSRIDRSDKVSLFAVAEAVKGAFDCLTGHIESTGAKVELEVAPNLPHLRGDKGQITQLFQNMFSNSIKYRQQSAESTLICVGFDESSQTITVSDNGLGFDMKHADRIFGVFQRLHTTDQYPGTGIGLAIVKKIIDRHGGRISVESQVNVGTTFRIQLPTFEPAKV